MTRFIESAIALPEIDLPEMNLPDLALPDLGLPEMNLPDLSLPNLSLSDSLGSLAAMANQIQIMVNGAIAHPVWAIALILLTITLIQIIADLAKRIVKAALAFVIRLPLSLSQWIWKRATAPAKPEVSAQAHQLIEQLESLRAEQDQIIAQLKRLLLDQAADRFADNWLKPSDQEPSNQEPSSQEQSTQEQPQPAPTGASKSSSTVSPDVG